MCRTALFKVGLSPFKKVAFICFNENPLKMMKNAFSFHVKSSFCPDVFDHVGKRLNRKTQVNFKIYDVKNWEVSIYNTYTAKYPKK